MGGNLMRSAYFLSQRRQLLVADVYADEPRIEQDDTPVVLHHFIHRRE